MMTKRECIAYAEAHLEVRYALSNGAFQAGREIRVEGCVNHSTGVAQPSAEVIYGRMNRESAAWGVNAILGDFHLGEGRIILALPYTRRPWGVGSGARGSWNNSRIQWETCEPAGHTYAGGVMIGYDPVKNQGYFDRMWKLLVAWNVYCAVKLGYGAETVNDHAESYRAGMGSNHADMAQWLPKHGKSMDHLREEVAAILAEEDCLTVEEVRAIAAGEVERLRPEERWYHTVEEVPLWARETVALAVEAGYLRGDEAGRLQLNADRLWGLTLARQIMEEKGVVFGPGG